MSVVADVILRSKSKRSVTLILGWLIFWWIRWREMDNPPGRWQHQDATVPNPNPRTQSRLIRVRRVAKSMYMQSRLIRVCRLALSLCRLIRECRVA